MLSYLNYFILKIYFLRLGEQPTKKKNRDLIIEKVEERLKIIFENHGVINKRGFRCNRKKKFVERLLLAPGCPKGIPYKLGKSEERKT